MLRVLLASRLREHPDLMQTNGKTRPTPLHANSAQAKRFFTKQRSTARSSCLFLGPVFCCIACCSWLGSNFVLVSSCVVFKPSFPTSALGEKGDLFNSRHGWAKQRLIWPIWVSKHRPNAEAEIDSGQPVDAAPWQVIRWQQQPVAGEGLSVSDGVIRRLPCVLLSS
ncbi:hypothetical protein VTK26DRAFT_2632 [Humicola hyalothermophila]